MKRLLVLLVALFMAGPAAALNTWTSCGSTTTFTGTKPSVSKNTCIEYRFDASAATQTFYVSASSALLKFDPNEDTAGASTAQIMVKSCLVGYTATANICTDALAAVLTGAGGSASTQKFEMRLPKGLWMITWSVAAGGGQTGVIQVLGED